MAAEQPDPRVAAVLAAAREHPGTTVTVFTEEDRETLRRVAARHRQRADEIEREAGTQRGGVT